MNQPFHGGTSVVAGLEGPAGKFGYPDQCHIQQPFHPHHRAGFDVRGIALYECLDGIDHVVIEAHAGRIEHRQNAVGRLGPDGFFGRLQGIGKFGSETEM